MILRFIQLRTVRKIKISISIYKSIADSNMSHLITNDLDIMYSGYTQNVDIAVRVYIQLSQPLTTNKPVCTITIRPKWFRNENKVVIIDTRLGKFGIAKLNLRHHKFSHEFSLEMNCKQTKHKSIHAIT